MIFCFFAFNTQRLSGTEKFIRFTPSIAGSDLNQLQYGSIDKFEIKRTNKALVLSTGISKYIPTSLIHQNNYGASLKLYYISGDLTQRFFDSVGGMNEIKNNSITRQAGINLFYDHAIYPNTRTAITFSFRSEYGYMDEEQHGFYGSTNLFGELNYFH